jgi:hypothetical protein
MFVHHFHQLPWWQASTRLYNLCCYSEATHQLISTSFVLIPRLLNLLSIQAQQSAVKNTHQKVQFL